MKKKKSGMGVAILIIGGFMAVSMAFCLMVGVIIAIFSPDSLNESQTVAEEQKTEVKDSEADIASTTEALEREVTESAFTYADLPAYSDAPYVEVNDNNPYFEDEELTTDAFEIYSDLDDLGRCGTAYANICQEIMPTEKRGEIGQIKPSGWHTVKYPEQITEKYLYNRCHLIAYQLAGENANEKNLITGTRYMNATGMVPFENEVADYVKETDHHVLYRVTPVFEGENLVASGVLIEAESVEDQGTGVKFCVFCYNVQPGIGIDYATGDSWVADTEVAQANAEEQTSAEAQATATEQAAGTTAYVLASTEATTAIAPAPETSADVYVWIPTNGGTKYHSNPNCSGMKNPEQVTLNTAIGRGFTACKKCY